MRCSGLLLDGAVERDQEVVTVGRGVGRDLPVDLLGDDELDQRLAERLHLEEVALGDRLGDLLRPVLADQVGDAGVRDHDLDGRDASAGDLREQALADHAAEDAGKDRADQLLLGGREELDHPADRLGGVGRVHGREDEVARLGGCERRFGRLGVAELADQDHVGVLAQTAAQGLGERGGVEPDLTLVDDAAVVGMDDLDRVFDRDDVLAARAVHVVDDRRERRRLSRAGGAGDEDETAVFLGEATDARRQREGLEVRHLARDDAEGDRDRAALPEAVDAESRQAGRRVGAVELSRLEERLQPLRRLGADLLEGELEVAFAQLGFAVELTEISVAAQNRRTLHLEVDVAGALFDGAS